jgi:hypothetical protein
MFRARPVHSRCPQRRRSGAAGARRCSVCCCHETVVAAPSRGMAARGCNRTDVPCRSGSRPPHRRGARRRREVPAPALRPARPRRADPSRVRPVPDQVARTKERIAQITKAQFHPWDRALEIEPVRAGTGPCRTARTICHWIRSPPSSVPPDAGGTGSRSSRRQGGPGVPGIPCPGPGHVGAVLAPGTMYPAHLAQHDGRRAWRSSLGASRTPAGGWAPTRAPRPAEPPKPLPVHAVVPDGGDRGGRPSPDGHRPRRGSAGPVPSGSPSRSRSSAAASMWRGWFNRARASWAAVRTSRASW